MCKNTEKKKFEQQKKIFEQKFQLSDNIFTINKSILFKTDNAYYTQRKVSL